LKISEEDRKYLIRFLWCLVILGIVAIVLFKFYIPSNVMGSSMFPTLEDGDRVIFYKLACAYKLWQRGDIVYLIPPNSDGKTAFVKRIVGLPGETVRVYDGGVSINGIPLREPYAYFDHDFHKLRENRNEIQIFILGDGEYFVMGDNRDNSNDSRAFGHVDRKNIYGKLILFYWPPKKFLEKPAKPYAGQQQQPRQRSGLIFLLNNYSSLALPAFIASTTRFLSSFKSFLSSFSFMRILSKPVPSFSPSRL
jgi:signal peptidase I